MLGLQTAAAKLAHSRQADAPDGLIAGVESVGGAIPLFLDTVAMFVLTCP